MNILGYAGEDIKTGDAVGVDAHGLLARYKWQTIIDNEKQVEGMAKEVRDWHYDKSWDEAILINNLASRTLIPDTIEQSVWEEWQRVWWD